MNVEAAEGKKDDDGDDDDVDDLMADEEFEEHDDDEDVNEDIGKSRKRSSTSSLAEAEGWHEVTCYCKRPFAGRPMIECSRCQTWIHITCAKIKQSNIPELWYCSVCKAKDPSLTASCKSRKTINAISGVGVANDSRATSSSAGATGTASGGGSTSSSNDSSSGGEGQVVTGSRKRKLSLSRRSGPPYFITRSSQSGQERQEGSDDKGINAGQVPGVGGETSSPAVLDDEASADSGLESSAVSPARTEESAISSSSSSSSSLTGSDNPAAVPKTSEKSTLAGTTKQVVATPKKARKAKARQSKSAADEEAMP